MPTARRSTDAACTKVYNFLSGQAANISSYSSTPIWAVVDGPYTIDGSKGGSFSTSGQVTLVPNPAYSGPQKATVTVQELPYTTDNAEFNALLGGDLDIGYLPQQDVTQTTANATDPGPNNPRLTDFYLTPWVLYGFNYAVLKFLTRPATTGTPEPSTSSSTSARPCRAWSTSRA